MVQIKNSCVSLNFFRVFEICVPTSFVIKLTVFVSRNGIFSDNFKTDFLGDDWNEYEDPYSRPRVRSGSVRSFKMPTTQNVRRMLSHEHVRNEVFLDKFMQIF